MSSKTQKGGRMNKYTVVDEKARKLEEGTDLKCSERKSERVRESMTYYKQGEGQTIFEREKK